MKKLYVHPFLGVLRVPVPDALTRLVGLGVRHRHQGSGGGPRIKSAPCPGLILLVLAGCQSAPSTLGRGGVDDDAFARSLEKSIAAVAESRGHPERMARSQTRHRRLLAGHFDDVVQAAASPAPAVAVGQEDFRPEPLEPDEIRPVLRPGGDPGGLERAGIGLPVVVRVPAPQDRNAPRAGYHMAATLVVQPGSGGSQAGQGSAHDQPVAPADPRIRDCCQLWFFYYPTGQPVPLSALQLREALNDVVAHTGLTRKMVLIGHSMGGILSRAQVSGISLSRAERILPGVSGLSDYNLVRRALIFEPREDVSRVLFLFVPHRGSRLASNRLGALGIRLIRLPDTLLNEAELALQQLAGYEDRRLPTSIHGLSPRSRFLKALRATAPTVPVHSIIGNRGRGDGSTGSDGVVPVSSARVEVAESELIVPTGHGGFADPAAVAEIKRIIFVDVEQQQAQAGAPAGLEATCTEAMVQAQ